MNLKRITHLKDGNQTGEYVLYWMQQSQRIHYNHALNYAVEMANRNNLPLVVLFALYGDYPEANERSFAFMLEGLVDVKAWLDRLKGNFVLRIGKAQDVIFDYMDKAHTVVFDYGYLRHQRQWRKDILDEAIKRNLGCEIDMIDTDTVVPVNVASNKREYGAYTIRPKIMKEIANFRDMDSLPLINVQKNLGFVSDDDLTDIDQLLKKLKVDTSVPRSPYFRGGYLKASNLFSNFLYNDLRDYKDRNDPSNPKVSYMSLYLHFGQISPLELLERMTLAMLQDQIDQASIDSFVEQLVVRRELSFNYVRYTKGYDKFETMTQDWAYKTMKAHEDDERNYIYSTLDYEHFQTHDEAFNAAMIEMVKTGYMHNYMRMYWAKKIIEWSPTYKEAYETILYLNNKYFIDGRDANSYTGVAWCFGNHDRPWTERSVFGQLRYMNFEGLKRKFKIDKYINEMKQLLKD